MNIHFNFPAAITLRNRLALKAFILKIFKDEKQKLNSLNYIFCSDAYLLQMNKTYLAHNYFTDIITFDLTEPGSNKIDGEIYISADTVRENAHRYKTTISKELHRVIFHGALHLCGYKDKTAAEQQLMTQKEDHYIHLYFNVPGEIIRLNRKK